MKRFLKLTALMAAALPLIPAAAQAEALFWSTQAKPVPKQSMSPNTSVIVEA